MVCEEKNPALTSTEKNNLLKKKSSTPPPQIMKWSLHNDAICQLR